MEKKYKVFSSAIIHELLDDEVIIANLDSGAYYSLRASSVVVWQMLVSGQTLENIAAVVSEKYDSAPPDLLAQLDFFINRLCEEGLLISHFLDINQNTESSDLVWPAQWGELSFDKYDEMKNLLMLDPIHEVDEQGWPHRSEKG